MIGTSLKVGGSVVEFIKQLDFSVPLVLINKETIEIEVGSIVKTCEQLNIDSTTLPKLTAKTHIGCRYILPEAKDKIFTLVDFETGIEYDCIRNGTIFLHLGIPYSENEAKYIT